MTTKSYKHCIFLITIILSFYVKSELTPEQLKMIETLPPDQRSNVIDKMQSASDLNTEIEEKFEEATSLSLKPELKDLEDFEDYCPDCIYGFNFFLYSPTTFETVCITWL